MRLETVMNVARVENTQRVTASYEQWVDPVTNKTEQRVKLYVLELYNDRGLATTHTNGRTVDQLV